ncbi:membrane protein [Cnuibacter physcomitrellae]|uniref:Uncharacterized protein n=1 Tax=Cnuibacter physcomitrellae TaxID=1619308 RepID=A0A1X9LQX7_9MICO|nr:DUF4395 domain-containing protein [Cnuibacter physcomitrellae]ARJ05539.1 hypothetical protein B5808_10115 [Cnuibacter physcomitrellae]GGI35916.1 membrane protein [Cnuibacter physcomitrellae]
MTDRAAPAGIDPRGPRFGAAITAVLLLVVVGLSVSTPVAGPASAAWWLLAALAVLFGWGALAGIARHPWGLLFRTLVRPRLAPPADLEDPRPPTFAQGVGLAVTGIAVVLGLFSVPFAVTIGAALAFVAAFLNAVFGFCIGCQLYLLLVRARAPRAAGH